MVGDHEAAGAIPAVQTLLPPFHGGTRDYESRWLRFDSSRWYSICVAVWGRAWFPSPGSSVRFAGGVLIFIWV